MKDKIVEGQDFTVSPYSLASSAKPLTMCWIPSGRFIMGCNETDRFFIPDVNDELDVIHTSGFWLSRYPITVAQWNLIMEDTSATDTPNIPTTNVNWFEAMEFCNKLNCLHTELPNSRHFRLPTEAEWEYTVHLGGQPSQWDTTIDEYVWHSRNARELQEVGLKKPNKLGIYDMQGNADVWLFDSSGYLRPDGVVKDYLGTYDTKRNIRGGSYQSPLDGFMFSLCSGNTFQRTARMKTLGFRICLGIKYTRWHRFMRWVNRFFDV